MSNTVNDPKIIVALDYPSAQTAMVIVDQLDPSTVRLKVGKELFTAEGPAFVEVLHKKGFAVFLDLKFHDIPNTVAKACRAAADLGVWMVNVHASGGERMMQSARAAVDAVEQPPLLIAVTVLTSMTQEELFATGVQAACLQSHVSRLAQAAQRSGMDGVVCSAQEAPMLRERCGSDFCLVTPGIRLADSPSDDQRRTVTPFEAVERGASYLVIGRPITQAEQPQRVVEMINTSLAAL